MFLLQAVDLEDVVVVLLEVVVEVGVEAVIT
jgi:hypothetical protein